MMTESTAAPASFQQRFQSIPQHLKIMILYHDTHIVVINKPSNLRSVPGNAQVVGQKRQRQGNRLTAQEAWIAALESFEIEEREELDMAKLLMKHLTINKNNFSSIPRRWTSFHRYVERNQHRLLVGPNCKTNEKGKRIANPERLNASELESLSKQVHNMIESRQIPLLNLPKSTRHEDSAFGQLLLLEYCGKVSGDNLHAVHRLDCEVRIIKERLLSFAHLSHHIFDH